MRLLILWMGCALFAGETGRFSGEISLVGGQSQKGYLSYVTACGNSDVRSITTDEQGRFDVNLPAPEQYYLFFVVPGYEPQAIFLNLLQNRDVAVDVRLDYFKQAKDTNWYVKIMKDGAWQGDRLPMQRTEDGRYFLESAQQDSLVFSLVDGDQNDGVPQDADIVGFGDTGDIYWRAKAHNGKVRITLHEDVQRRDGQTRGWLRNIRGALFECEIQRFYTWLDEEAKAFKTEEDRKAALAALDVFFEPIPEGFEKDLLRVAANRYLSRRPWKPVLDNAVAQRVLAGIAEDPLQTKDMRPNLWLHLNGVETYRDDEFVAKTQPKIEEYLRFTPLPAYEAEAAATLGRALRNQYPELARKQWQMVSDRWPDSFFGKLAESNLKGLALVGKPAPDFQIADLKGMPLRLSDYRGKLVFLYFWVTTCKPCVTDMPKIQRAFEQMDTERMTVISICLDKDVPGYKQFQKRFTMSWPQATVLGDDHPVAKEYRVVGFPSFYVISPEGIILDQNPEKLRRKDDLLEALNLYLEKQL